MKWPAWAVLPSTFLGVVVVSLFARRVRAAAPESASDENNEENEESKVDGGQNVPGKRVRVSDYARLAKSDPRLVALPKGYGTKTGLRVHTAILGPLTDLIDEARKAGHELAVSSAWREHRWASKQDYEDQLRKLYGPSGTIRQFPEDRYLVEGRRLLAFDSPHETGLTVDFRSGTDLLADSRTIAKQRTSPVYLWLVDNAGRFGAVPYKVEPWHWEFPIERSAFDQP